jgi:hypothetical protein
MPKRRIYKLLNLLGGVPSVSEKLLMDQLMSLLFKKKHTVDAPPIS